VISGQLLQTKLTFPQRRQAVVSRSRLIERLNAGIESKLILVSAPAGFGKTTLITDWIANTGRPVAWLSLDEGDNDPALFMEYFVAALRKVKPKIGASAMRLFRSSQQFTARTILTDLINEICTLSIHFLLVLDDYHAIKNKSIHSTLDYLIDNMPQNMHLAILTRSDPPLHLSHLRGRGQLIELRASDLRFTIEEVGKFLNQVMSLNLSKEEISSLDARSEGWIAGLQMAAISLKDRTDKSEFIAAFSGSNRNIMDYLFEEVFERQTADIQSFMLQTSILEQLTGPLCDAVTGRNDSGVILENMQKTDLFVLSLDEENRWYRYHHLFADLLLHNLKIAQPHLIPLLYERASLWYEQNDLSAPAIEHALLGQNFALAASLIIRHAETTLVHGELATLRRWIHTLPAENINASPILIVFQVLAELWLHEGPLKREEARLQKVVELDPQGQDNGPLLTVQAILTTAQGNTRRSVELAQQALAVLPAESTFWRSVAIPCLGQFSLLRGELPAIPAAISLYNEAVRTAKKTGNLFTTVLALRRLAETYIAAGQLHIAENCYQSIVDLAVDSQGKSLPLASFGLIGLGNLAREWHEMDEAVALLDRGIRLADGKLGSWQLEGYVNLARLKAMQGLTAEADQLIAKAWQLAAESPDSKQFELFVTAHEIPLNLRRRNLAAAISWAREHSLNRTGISLSNGELERKSILGYYASELEQITLARVNLAQGLPADALKILEIVSGFAEELKRTGVLVEVQMLEALAYKALDNPRKSLDLLEKSLSLAEPEGYVSLFVEEGNPMARLLYEAAQQKIKPEYVHRLLEAFPRRTPESAQPAVHSGIAEPLSDRELKVLDLLARGFSNKEIASHLSIEVRTVKWHTGNIFGKLNVKNRNQAVVRARELNVLQGAL
jgi:LuxR family transcriptional regulator, maltose regulon positive regulatory protein